MNGSILVDGVSLAPVSKLFESTPANTQTATYSNGQFMQDTDQVTNFGAAGTSYYIDANTVKLSGGSVSQGDVIVGEETTNFGTITDIDADSSEITIEPT